MSCDIIEPGYVQIDGSDYYLGGAIGGATFNFSDISSQSTADITLYEAGSSLGTPIQGSSVTVTVMNYTWTMTVSKYTSSASAKGATQMRVTLTDTSHWYLDQDFIVLNEEFPAANVNSNCHVAGGKYGPIPEDKLLPSYMMVPNSDTRYGHLRAWFSTLKFGLVVDEDSGNAPLPKLLTADDVNNLTENTPGKSMYWSNQSSPYEGDIFYGYDKKDILIEDKSLYDILGEDGLKLLGESCYETNKQGLVETDAEGKKISLFPNIEMQEVGSLRSVMTSFANRLGYMCYWDMENGKIELVTSIDTSDGREKMNNIRKTCFVTAASSSSDFTTTNWEGAVGSITASNPGQSQSSGGRGGKQSRFLSATLLKPEFTYRECSNPAEGVQEGSFRGPRNVLQTPYVEYKETDTKAAQKTVKEVGEAITVALGPEEDWPRFVAQEILKANINESKKLTDSSKWRLDQCTDITTALNAKPAGIGLPSRNVFIANYYRDSTAASPDLPCSTDIFALNIDIGSKPGKALSTKMNEMFGVDKSGKPINENVHKVAGPWVESKDNNEKLTNAGFQYGTLCAFVKKHKTLEIVNEDGDAIDHPVDAILGEKGFVEGVDALRDYLRSIGDFFSRFYVVQSSGYNTARTAKLGRDYGYYVAGSSSMPGMNMTPQPGFTLVKLKPFHSVSECGNEIISQLARSLAQSYCTDLGHGGEPSVEDLLDEITTIDFIYALDNTRILSQAGTNSVSTEIEPVNGTSGDDKVTPPRKDNLEKLFVKGKNRFNSATADSLRSGDDEPELYMFLLQRDKAALPLESPTGPQTIVSGGVTVTQQVHQPKNDPPVSVFINDVIKENHATPINDEGTVQSKCKSPALEGGKDEDGDGNADNNYKCIEGGTDPNNGCPQPANPFWCCERGRMVTDNVAFFVISNGRPWPDINDQGGKKLNFFQGRRTPDYLERAPSKARAWFNLEGAQGDFTSNEAGNFYLCEGTIPETNTSTYWKGSLNMGISLDAADISLVNTIAMEYGSEAGSASAYSAANKTLMRSSLSSKVDTNVAYHDAIGSNETLSIIVGDKMEYEDEDSGITEDLELPTWKEGLESISISSSQGKTVLGITVGNKLLMRAVKAALDLRSSTSTFQHQQTKHSSDAFRDSIGQGFYNRST